MVRLVGAEEERESPGTITETQGWWRATGEFGRQSTDRSEHDIDRVPEVSTRCFHCFAQKV